MRLRLGRNNSQMKPFQDELIEAHELQSIYHLSSVVLIDARDSVAYNHGHIPGAVSIQDIFYYICLPDNGGLPALREHFTRLFSAAGIRPDDRVIVYEDAQDNGYGKSCRGWLILKYLGHENVSVLHGGIRAWKTAGFPLETVGVKKPAVMFPSRETSGHLVSVEEVRSVLGQEETVLLDCRDYAEWLGANSSPYGYDYCPRKGRIPGAKWLEWYQVMERVDGLSRLRSPNEILELCDRIGVTPEKKVIVYCFKGARASVVVMALRRAGFPSVSNYFSAWNEWSRDFTLPVDDSYPEE